MSNERQIRLHYHSDCPYEQALALQRELLARIADDPAEPEHVLLVEHRPVITLGRQGKDAHSLKVSAECLRRQGVELFPAGRGGDATYHGPGQWTVYPLLRLEHHGRDLHRYLRLLEEIVISYLCDYNIHAGRRTDKTGVWIGHNKICAIGIAVSRWVSWHGFALNICPDMRPFREFIVPCGILPEEGGVTSLAELTGQNYDMQTEAARLMNAFARYVPARYSYAPAPEAKPTGSRRAQG